MRVLKLLILLMIALFPMQDSYAEVKFSVAAGLRTFMVIGDNPNSSPIIQRDTNKPQFIGGGLTQVNSGVAIMGLAEFGEEGNIVVPFGFEYTELIARERIPISRRTTAYLHNTIITPSALLGFNYKFFRFPFADVKAYAGLEINAFFFQSPEFYRKIEYKNLDSAVVYEGKTKTPATRMGGDVKIGFDGNIISGLYINANIAFGVANLLFRDDSRGELLTPTAIDETKESIVSTMRFGLLLRYEF
jgi:hypothetical protein